MARRCLIARLLIATAAGACLCMPARADEATRVAAAIEAGEKALLDSISPYDRIKYRRSPRDEQPIKVRGTMIRSRGPTIQIKTTDGNVLRIPRQSIVQWITAGHIEQERGSHLYSGPSALVALALLSAGVETTHPKLVSLLAALAEDDAADLGTYVHSLRATVWSALSERPVSRTNRLKYRKLLHKDMNWLMKAMRRDGSYGYTADRSSGRADHSNTQFANLGLWAGAAAHVEVADRYWQTIGKHWMEAQDPTGGWSYVDRLPVPSSSMTVAGCNSLYIVLDRFYSRKDSPYRLFKGARPKKKAREAMRWIHHAVGNGDEFLESHLPDVVQSRGYELFGLERLGLASGRAIIGGIDWFRAYAGPVADRRWGRDSIADAFALIFLVHGQAPVLIQKLEHGETADTWNYYHRDLYSLTRYLSRTFERLYRWQRLPIDAGLRELHDAPILYINGRRELALPPDTFIRLRQYIDGGGTVFLHADRAGKPFIRSATQLFERMFSDRGLHFQTLDESHPLYRCQFGGDTSPWKHRVPLAALSDGARLFVLLCPVDVAGAWHQARQVRYPDLFKIMANVRVYCAPPYGQLPTRLRPEPLAGAPARSRGRLSLRRLPHAGAWNTHAGAWKRYAEGLRHRTGLDLLVNATGAPFDAAALRQKGIVHLTMRGPVRLDGPAEKALASYLQSGGLLLVDAADGQPAGIQAVRRFVDALGVGVKGVLADDHPIVTGAVPGAEPLGELATTRAGASLSHGGAPPPLVTREVNGHVAVIACPFDLIVGIDGHFVWNRSGYRPQSTARLVDNILLWRFDQINKLSALEDG